MVKSGGDVLMVFTGDWHAGNQGTDHQQLIQDLNLLGSLNRHVVLMGDLIDNFIPESPGGGQHDAIMRVADQKKLVQHVLKTSLDGKIAAIIQGCFLPGTTVTASDYTQVPIEEASSILGRKKSHDVVKVWNNVSRGNINTIKIFGNNMFPINSTGDHMFDVMRLENVACKNREKGRCCHGLFSKGKFCLDRCSGLPSFNVDKAAAQTIRPGDFLRIDKPSPCRGTFFSSDDMWLFGWYLAEGSASIKTCSTCFSLGGTEWDVAERITKQVKSCHGDIVSSVKIVERKERNSIDVVVYGKKFAEWISKHCGIHCDGKRMSKQIIENDDTTVKILIEAFLKGDGHERNNGECTLTTTSPHLASQFYHLLLRTGTFSSLRKMSPRKGKKQAYEIFYLKREGKKRRFIEMEDAFYVRVLSNEQHEYDGPVYNIQVDSEDHVYRVGGVSVYNCHEEWSFQEDDFDFSEWLSGELKTHYMGWGGIIHVMAGNQEYSIGVSHKFRGGFTNPILPGKNLYQAIGPFDVGVTAHSHMPFCSTSMIQGRLVHLLTVGSYKIEDRHCMRQSLTPAVPAMPAVLLSARKREIRVFLDFKEALPCLESLSPVLGGFVGFVDEKVEDVPAKPVEETRDAPIQPYETYWQRIGDTIKQPSDYTMSVAPMLEPATIQPGDQEKPMNLAGGKVDVGKNGGKKKQKPKGDLPKLDVEPLPKNDLDEKGN
jgi:hypothetical protein